MHNGADCGTSAPSEVQDDLHRAIVSELVSLIESVQASMELIQSAIGGEATPGNQEPGTNVVVLDDVTPRYAEVSDALDACNASLGAALHFLLDTRTPQPDTDERGYARPVRSVGRA
jgi:hypothetical protein